MSTISFPFRRGPAIARAFNPIRRYIFNHPLASVLGIALVARVAFAVVSFVANKPYLIPDEGQYVQLASFLAHGRTAEEWFPGYGQSLFDSTRVFTAPLVLLFELFGPSRLIGQLFSAVVGAAAAGVTVAIGLRFLRRPFAFGAGLVVALLPSQVLFSSVVLREGHIWLSLVLVALGAVYLASPHWRDLGAGLVLGAIGLLALAFLRTQTLVAAAWAFAVVGLIASRQLWAPRVTGGVVLAAIVPWITGIGVGGVLLVSVATPNLAGTRQTLAAGANSAFGGAGSAQPPQTSTVPPSVSTNAAPSPAAAPAASASAGAKGIAERSSGSSSDGLGSAVMHLPQGVVDVSLRPFPWQSTAGAALLFARVESLAWYVLYILGILGLLVSVRRRTARNTLAFPVCVTALILGIGALTEGNLGTAFRHREEILWAVALAAAAGLQWLVDRGRPPVDGALLEQPSSAYSLSTRMP